MRHTSPGDVHPPLRALAWASLAIALVPLIVAAVRTVSGDWAPVGDAAIVTIRARDVLKLDRYADLQIAWDDGTVAAWLGPVPEGEPDPAP